jgi:hypothetical protein
MRELAPRRAVARIVLTLACLAGCGGSSRNPPAGSTGATASGPPDAAFSEAPHSPLPQLTYQGGPILVAPKIVTVTFPGDANASTLETFDDAIVTSAWWTAVTAGFCDGAGACIGQGAPGGHVELTTPAAASYTDSTSGGISSLQQLVSDEIATGTFPPPDANTLYVIYFPPTTTITLAQGSDESGTSCDQFGGYHNSILVSPGATGTTQPAPIVYAVIPECAPRQGSGLDPLQSLTFAASHEIVEASSDPVQTTTTLGYYLNLGDETALGWDLVVGGEAADLCVDVTGLHDDETTADGYTVQRIWSNANAAAGIDPCIPLAANDVYFSVAPSGTGAFAVLDVGQSATFEVDAFSTEAMGAWTLSGVDWATKQKRVNDPLLTFTFNGAPSVTVNNGDKVEVTVTLDADPAQLGGAEGILLSTVGPVAAPTAAHLWPILVVTPDEATGGS